MWTVSGMERETGKLVCEDYASFDSYEEARSFADRHEMEARVCGWTWVVAYKS